MNSFINLKGCSGSLLFLFLSKKIGQNFFFIHSLTCNINSKSNGTPTESGPPVLYSELQGILDARTVEKLVTSLPVFEPTLIQLGPADSQQNKTWPCGKRGKHGCKRNHGCFCYFIHYFSKP